MKARNEKNLAGRRLLALLQLAALAVLGIGLWLAGCSPNDPFDPNSVLNAPPVVRLSMTPVDTNTSINPTSYFKRTFHWSGTDRDGWVTEFHVAILTDPSVPAVWDTTARTDTTMTFATDASGEAQATFLLACRDNRGAMSDTLEQYIPLRNFPPSVNFKSDFNPLINMQREFRDINGDVTENPSAAVDTAYWNWGAMNFRLFALDLDGLDAMDPFYRYTFRDPATGDPDTTFEADDPNADPIEGWIRGQFVQGSISGVVDMVIFTNEAPAGPATTLTVSVVDEAQADTRFTYSWEVREPAGPVLYVPDSASPQAKSLYRGFLADEYGEGGWQEYSFWFGYPDHSYVLLESMRKFQAVLWADGGTTSPRLLTAAQNGGALDQYLRPLHGEDPGKLLMISKGLAVQGSPLPVAFYKQLLGISNASAPLPEITTVAGKRALGLAPHLPALTSLTSFGRGRGLKLPTEEIPKAEPIYQMEWCRQCYSTPEPWDPVVGMRFPDRATAVIANSVCLSIQLEYFNNVQVYSGLSAILSTELGVTAP